MSRLWYDHPASEWEEALPIGNGRIGAMVYGGTDRERLQVNEESIWLGGPVNLSLIHISEPTRRS